MKCANISGKGKISYQHVSDVCLEALVFIIFSSFEKNERKCYLSCVFFFCFFDFFNVDLNIRMIFATERRLTFASESNFAL